jgi:hypothetical protein
MFVNELKEAFSRLVARESHNLLAITRKTGVNNSTLNRLNASKASFENIPAKTIERLFPRMVVYFFPEDAPQWNDNLSEMRGNDETVEELKAELNRIFDILTPADRVHLFTIVAANFGRKIALSKNPVTK